MDQANKPTRAADQTLTTSTAISKEAFLQTFSNLPVKAETSLAEVIRAGTPNFGMLNAGTGTNAASILTIKALLLNLLDFFTVPWNATQLSECAEIISGDFYWLTQAEFKLFTMRAKRGMYGTDYNKLSPIRLLQWLESFAEECRYERANVSLAKPEPKPLDEEAPGTIDVRDRLTAFVHEHFGKPPLDEQEQEAAYQEAKRMQAQKNAVRQQEYEQQLKNKQP